MKSFIFQAIKLLSVIVESVPVKMLRKNVRNRDFLIVYTRVRRNERVHGQKAKFPGVYTPRNIEWKKSGHVHAEKYIFSGVYTTTFFHTRLNTQKKLLYGVYTRVWESLSAWVVSSTLNTSERKKKKWLKITRNRWKKYVFHLPN